MLTEIKAGQYTVRGVSLGGVYTSLYVPELSYLFDTGIPVRSFAAANVMFLSHAHADHMGALVSLLGIRGLVGKTRPLKVVMPKDVVADVNEFLAVCTRLQRYDLSIEAIGLSPGERYDIAADSWVEAFRTHHTVPSLGYQLCKRIKKLKDEYKSLPGHEIGRLRREGKEDMFHVSERRELAYATDTLVEVLDHTPSLYKTKTLIIECTFLDDRKPRKLARAGCHIHLDELIDRADQFENEHLVLMHFSQIYKPREVREILEAKCPAALHRRIVPFVPDDMWPG